MEQLSCFHVDVKNKLLPITTVLWRISLQNILSENMSSFVDLHRTEADSMYFNHRLNIQQKSCCLVIHE
jgi:hypothetical protein